MKIYYRCECCGLPIDMIEVDKVDEERFGFDCLTDEERKDIIKIDTQRESIYVQSLCDECIVTLGMKEDMTVMKTAFLH